MGMGRRIRIWKESGLYHATFNCIDRAFLLKPSATVNNAVGACLARAVDQAPLAIHSATTNINHMEVLFSIGRGQLDNASRFLKKFAGSLAKELNRHYGREGHFWSGRARVEEVVSDVRAEHLLGYGACNVVKDGLVERALHWKGFSTTAALLSGEKLKFEYVDRTLWWRLGANRREVDPAAYTKTVELKVRPLPSWQRMSVGERQARFGRIVKDHEAQARKEREAEGTGGVMGMERIERVSAFARPKTRRERSAQPLCHADTVEQYRAYAAEYREIAGRHREASVAYRGGRLDVEFPDGTFRPPLMRVCQSAV